MKKPFSLYLHFPYCWSKCHYCAFNSIRYDKPQSRRFLSALKREIEGYGRRASRSGRRLETLYMGGGTPSIFSADQILDVLDRCRTNFSWAQDIEITVEANPGTVDRKKLEALRLGGIRRLSLGIQSFHDDELEHLGRAHSSRVARDAFDSARAAGFENINLDFIYALSDQSIESWEETLQKAIRLGPEHISAYALTIEEGTRFEEDFKNGLLKLPEEDRQIRFDDRTRALLSDAGYRQYEISNYARPGYACRHNIACWSEKEYLGLGPGAHSYYEGRRFSKIEDIDGYIASVEGGGEALGDIETVGPETAFREALTFGLRMTGGVDLGEIRGRFSVSIGESLGRRFEGWSDEGLLITDGPKIRLTHEGRRVWDSIAQEIIGPP